MFGREKRAQPITTKAHRIWRQQELARLEAVTQCRTLRLRRLLRLRQFRYILKKANPSSCVTITKKKTAVKRINV